jgi:hypothetical protein
VVDQAEDLGTGDKSGIVQWGEGNLRGNWYGEAGRKIQVDGFVDQPRKETYTMLNEYDI